MIKDHKVLTGDVNKALPVPGPKASAAEWDTFLAKYQAVQKARGQAWGPDDQAIFGAFVRPPKELAEQYEWVPGEGYRKKQDFLFKDFSR